MREVLKKLYRLLSSMQLSVYLLGFGVILVFFGTLDQVNWGIYEVQKRYFQSFIAFWQYPVGWPGGQVLKVFVLPMPGGYLIGGLLLLNLAFAHFRYYRPRLRTVGIILIHGGFSLLLIGQFAADVAQEDFQMWIEEGGDEVNYAEAPLGNELVIIDHSDASMDRVLSIPDSTLKNGAMIEHPEMPVTIRVQRYFKNSRIMRLEENQHEGLLKVNRGIGRDMRLGVFEAAPVYSQSERNVTSAVVEVLNGDQSLGTWFVANVFDEQFPAQSFSVNGGKFSVAMRFTRRYFPFRFQLKDFSHDKYPGTDIPLNFSSLVNVRDEVTDDVREALIYMNHPLRHEGYTFYQASFGNNDTASMLQVVRNPSWLLPYIACILMSLGLVYQFTWSLVKFVGRFRK